jgi:hypothetical protein
MELYLDPEQRTNMTVQELARHIFRVAKVAKQEKEYGRNTGVFHWLSQDDFYLFYFRVSELRDWFCKRFDGGRIQKEDSLSFFVKFYEAIALLKRQGLLMPYLESDKLCFTSVGERSGFHDGIFILVDDAQEIVESLKAEVEGIDLIVEQYYLESLRACQESFYISSIICLGAASERAIDCLKKAIVECDPQHKSLEKKWISDSVEYILTNIKTIFGSAVNLQLRNELKEQLDLTEKIYRLNRNKAGHPESIPMNIKRCDQENYLNSFRRYVITIFKVIDALSSAS